MTLSDQLQRLSRGSGRSRTFLMSAVALAAALTSLVAVGERAEATWTKPPNLSGTGAAADPVTAVSENGFVALAWRRMDGAGDWRIELRVRSDAGVLSNSKTVSLAGNSAYAPDVAIDSTGRALVVWSQRNDDTGTYAVQGLYRAPDGKLTNIRDISTGVGAGSPLQSGSPQVEFNPDGSAVVAWETVFASASYRAVARGMTPAGGVAHGWQELSGDGVNLRPVALAVDANGVASIAWSRNDGANMLIETRTRTSAGALGALNVVSPTGQNAPTPGVAVTPDGNTVVAWIRYDTVNDSLYARQLSPAGVFGPNTLISAADKNVDDTTSSRWGEVTINAGGDAVFAWQQVRPCCSREVAVRGLSAGGTLSPIVMAGNATSVRPQLATDPTTGGTYVAFTRTDSNFDDRISVRSRAADGTLGPVSFLSAGGQDSGHPDLAVTGAGLAVLTWVRNDGSDGTFCCGRVQYSVGP
jgi:hypothetical protein